MRPGTRGLRRALARAAAGSAFVLLGAALPAPAQSKAALEGVLGRPYQRLIERVAERYQLDPYVFGALVDVESGRRADAVSPKGARGLGQLMPGTARRFGVDDVHDPEDNLDGSAQYLSWLLARYDGNLALALAAYNAGEGAVDRSGGVPNYPETRRYVRQVLDRAGLREAAAKPAAEVPDRIRVVPQPGGKILLTNVR